MSRIVLFVAWMLVIVCGAYFLATYELTPSLSGTPPETWPDDANIETGRNKPTLLMFVHPRCPCTRASLSELAILMTKCQGQLETKLLITKPAGTTSDWLKTDLVEQAQQIPGVVVMVDANAQIATRFKTHTSGEVVFYDQSGRLRFHGGITASRGHHGDNLGRQAVTSLVHNGTSSTAEAPVFGCPLRNQSSSDI